MKPQIIQLPKFLDKRGNLSFFEHPKQLPFEIVQTYFTSYSIISEVL